MKKVLKMLPQILFAASLILMGAIGKITGAAPAVDMFTQIDLLGMGEQFGRLAVGFGQLFAGIGVFFKPTRKSAAVLGIAVMAGAIFYHLTLFGGSPAIAIATMALGIWILLSGKCGQCKSKKCEGETCKA